MTLFWTINCKRKKIHSIIWCPPMSSDMRLNTALVPVFPTRSSPSSSLPKSTSTPLNANGWAWRTMVSTKVTVFCRFHLGQKISKFSWNLREILSSTAHSLTFLIHSVVLTLISWWLVPQTILATCPRCLWLSTIQTQIQWLKSATQPRQTC